jgi:hypothetical protein
MVGNSAGRAPLDQQDEQLHGEFFQAQWTRTPLEPIAGLVECELAEMEFVGRKSPHDALRRIAEMMPHDPPRSNCTSNLGIHQNFISSL